MLKNHSIWSIYVIGRILSVLLRPLCLYLCSSLSSQINTLELAHLFLSTSFAILMVSVDSHREYYISYFRDKSSNIFQFLKYIGSLIPIIFFGIIISASLCYFLSQNFLLALAGSLFFVSEKLFDELQRFFLFKELFYRWGINSIYRFLTLIITISIFILFQNENLSISQTIFITSLANLIFFAKLTPYILWTIFTNINLIKIFIKKSLFLIWQQKYLWMMQINAVILNYTDRMIISIFDRLQLPIFMMTVMSFSVTQMLVDSFYISTNRESFLVNSSNARKMITTRSFVFLIMFGILIGAGICIIIYLSNKTKYNFSFSYYIYIMFVQIIISFNMIPQQILYWQKKEIAMFKIDLLCSFVIYCVIFLAVILKFNIDILLLTIAISYLIRCFYYFILLEY